MPSAASLKLEIARLYCADSRGRREKAGLKQGDVQMVALGSLGTRAQLVNGQGGTALFKWVPIGSDDDTQAWVDPEWQKYEGDTE